jgi:hypothetical protein
MSFRNKLFAAQQHNNSQICISLDIVIADSPLPMLVEDEPMFPFARDIIDATRDIVCAYKINPAYYLCEGAAGMVALERIVRYIPPNIPIIWDAKFAENSPAASNYARGAFEQFHADAVTLAPTTDKKTMLTYLRHRDKGIFVCYDPASGGITFSESMGIALDAADWNALIPTLMGARDVLLLIETAWHPNADNPNLAQLYKHPHALDELQPIVSVSRPILYASKRMDFATAARSATLKLCNAA